MDTPTVEAELQALLETAPESHAGFFLGSKIPADKLRNARAAHAYPEDVFFLHDTTVFGSARNSVLIGRHGLSIKLSDEQSPLRLDWEAIDAVSASGHMLAVQTEGRLYLFRLGYTPLEAVAEGRLLPLLQSLAHAQPSSWRRDMERLQATVSSWEQVEGPRPSVTEAAALLGQLHEKLGALVSRPEDFRESLAARAELSGGQLVVLPVEYASLAVLKARALIASGRPEGVEELRLLTALLRKVRPEEASAEEEDEKGEEHSEWRAPFLRPALACALHHLANQSDAPDAQLLLYRMAAAEGDESLRQAALQRIHALDLAAGFTRLRPERRDILLCTSLWPSWPPAEFRCSSPGMLQQLPWRFPVGHPVEGEFYARHPLRPDVYLLLEDYHSQLFQDRFGELKDLLAALGAIEIEIDAAEEFGRRMLSAYQSKVGGSAASAVVEGAARVETQEKEVARSDGKRAVRYRLRLSPSRTPHLPEGLVWFEHEPTWQRLASTARSGACEELSVEFRMNEEYAVSRKRLQRLGAELTLFSGQVTLSLREETEQFLQELRQTSWQVTARFQPVSPGAGPQPRSGSEPEAEYAKDVADVCVDGELSALAGRILARRRQRWGLSAGQAERIEQQVLAAQRLTEAEREYLEDVKECWRDGALSEDARRLLTRRRLKLGLNEERALALEKSIGKGAD